MTTPVFGPQNSNAAMALPLGTAVQRYGQTQTWVVDSSAPGKNDATILDASFFNRIIGSLEYLVQASGIVATPGDFTVLRRAVLATLASSAPVLLDTIKELADALNDDPQFSVTVMDALTKRLRVDAVQGLTPEEQLTGRNNLGIKPVAATGSYSDLAGKPFLGSAAAQDVGVGVGNVVQLNADEKLPAVDASQLTNIPYSGLTGTPTLGTAAALDVGVTANKVVRLDGAAKLPALDGSQLINMPISAGGAPLSSPHFTDVPTAPTAALGTNSTQIATMAAVAAAVANLLASAPGTLDTLNELATALGDDPAFATTMTALIGTKMSKTSNLSDLANVAAARTALGLVLVASTGAYADLSGKPTLGTAAALDVGTTANKVLQLDGAGRYPALDGSAIMNIPIGAGYGGTSATSITPALGTKAFTTQLGFAYVVGSRVRATSTSIPTVWVEGQVASYSGGVLTITVDAIGTATLRTDWVLTIAGQQGAPGATGAAGTNGTNGAAGAPGTAGTNGANGATGATGATGAFTLAPGGIGSFAFQDPSGGFPSNSGGGGYGGAWQGVSRFSDPNTGIAIQLMQRFA